MIYTPHHIKGNAHALWYKYTYTYTHTHTTLIHSTHTAHTHMPTTQENAQKHLQTFTASRYYHLYTKFADSYGHLPNLSVCDSWRSPTSALLLSLFHGNDVKAFETAAIEDDAVTKMASNGALSNKILHKWLTRR